MTHPATPLGDSPLRSPPPPGRGVRRGRRGFVLPYVLLLLALCAVLLVRIAGGNLRQQIELAERETMVRRRWSEHSCRVALTDTAPRLFETALAASRAAADSESEPPSTIRAAFLLNGRRTEIVFFDESAKLDVNTLWSLSSGRAAAVVQRLVSPSGGISVRLQPHVRDVFTTQPKTRFTDLSQLFNTTRRTTPADLMAASGLVTCGGGGKLQFHSAPDAVLLALARALLEPDEAEALVALRRTQPEATLQKSIASLALDEDERRAMTKYFTETSTVFSLWMFVHETGRPRASQVVFTPGAESASRLTEW